MGSYPELCFKIRFDIDAGLAYMGGTVYKGIIVRVQKLINQGNIATLHYSSVSSVSIA